MPAVEVGAATQRTRRVVVMAIFAVSAAVLVYEVSLTRLFSLYFQYHFAFLAATLAVLGLSLGAAGRYLIPFPHSVNSLAVSLVALSLSFPLTAAAIARLLPATSILAHAGVALVPFALAGFFSSQAFARYAPWGGTLYSADLSGAAVGIAAFFVLLNWWGAFNAVLLLGLVAALAAALLAFAAGDGRMRTATLLALLVTGLILGGNLLAGVIDYQPQRLATAPRDKTMVQILTDPTQEARVVYSRWSPFARVDVVETDKAPAKYIFTDGGAGSLMLAFDGNLEALSDLRQSIDYLPFAATSAEETLVIGAGGGRDVLLALLAGARQITAVEVNPAVIDAVRAFSDFNGAVLERPEVTLVEGDARTFIERDEAAYDLIYLNLVYTQAAEPANQALVENYIFTSAAFRAYLRRLSPGGHVAVVSHNALEASRAAIIALRAWEEMGVAPAQALDRLALWMYPSPDPTRRTSILLLGRDALSAESLRALQAGARSQEMQPLFMPETYEGLFQPLRQGGSVDSFIDEDADYDLSPVSDDQPFFFDLDPGLPPPVRLALLAAAVIAGVVLLLCLLAFLRPAPGGRSRWLVMVFYAALIGAGFMLVEIPLIQRFQLVLGYPVLSLLAVLGTLLLAGGAGSLLSQRWPEGRLPSHVALAAVWIALLGAVYYQVLPALVPWLLPAPLGLRLAAIAMLTALLGLPMGIPFPGLMRLAAPYGRRVALLWGLNGAFAAVGSVGATVIAMSRGFGMALLGGVALYFLLAALAAIGFRKA